MPQLFHTHQHQKQQQQQAQKQKPVTQTAYSSPHQTLQATIDSLADSATRQQLSEAVDELVTLWTQQFNRLFDSLNQSQNEQVAMQQHLVLQTNRYHKALRESQYYRQKYTQVANQFSLLSRPLPPTPSPYDSFPSSFSLPSIARQHKHTSVGSSFASTFSSLSSARNSAIFGATYHEPDVLNFCEDSDPKDGDKDAVDLMNLLALDEPSRASMDESSPDYTDSSTHSNDGSHFDAPYDPDRGDTVTQPTMNNGSTQTELVYACGEGFWDTIARGKNNKQEVELLIRNYLRRGGNPNVAKSSPTLKLVKEGYGLIHALIAIKNTRALQLILQAGADPNALPLCSQQNDCVPPLVLAARMCYFKGIRLLLEQAHANIHQRGPQQETAFHVAAQSETPDIIKYLVQHSGTDLLETVDMHGASPLHYACMTNTTGIVSFLIRDCHMLPNVQDNKGETPLHYAIRHNRARTVSKLVCDLGVYPNSYVSKQTPTPLDLARMAGLKSVTDLLRNMGAKTTKEMEKTSDRTSSIKNGKRNSSTSSSMYNESMSILSRTSSTGSSAKSRKFFFGAMSSPYRGS